VAPDQFVRYIARDRFDAIGYQVVLALQVDIDLRPGLLGAIAPVDQAVMGQDPTTEEDDDNDSNEDHDNHGDDLLLL